LTREMSTQHDHALIGETRRRARPRRMGAVVLVGVALAGVVALTTAWTSARTIHDTCGGLAIG